MADYEKRDDIKAVLKGLGKTQADLALALQMNYDVLHSFLAGRRKIPDKIEEKINEQVVIWENV